ncbi:MAG: Gfo/Idh/MocA family oxidoreductase [Candidatus Tectomicrobia bacterium]|uniref:Gfo/Idh/MocA family oxidoreductase n=1 Tax=Tectimicrobiota bacterium TaxID=2528274 RepID=A0A932I0S2_UNCTE|nr:Gfo/Idh/MocA family oxidoreductase [Candidatus Tectomicrobia bacterium]
MDALRVGIIGAGHMGSYHVAALAELMDARLTAVADLDRHRAEEVAGRYGAAAFSDAAQLVGRIDAAIVAVPTVQHYAVSRLLLQNGVHVLVEKPICPGLEEARDLFRLATKNGLVLHIGHVERFNGAVQELSQIVRYPILIECRRLGPFSHRVREDGVVLDLMIHDLDIAMRLVNEEIAGISAAGASVLSDRDDVANVQIHFTGGCIANLTASRVTQNKIRTLAITQPDAYITLDYADQELRIHRQASSEHSLSREELKYREQSQVERLFVHKENPLKIELRHFLAAVRAGAVVADPERELMSLDVALRIVRMLNLPAPARI